MDKKFFKILVAEDAALMQKILLGFLNELGKFKFLLVTAEGEREQIAFAKSLGADGHIVKPLSKEDLEKNLRIL